MTTYGEQGYRKSRTEYLGRFKSEDSLHSGEIILADSRASALSDLEVETLNRIDASGTNSYSINKKTSLGQYLAQQYTLRTLLRDEEPNPKVIAELTAD